MPASAGLRDHVYSKAGKNRVVVEKPFGKDFDSSKELSKALGGRWEEDEVLSYLV
jgi:glucose-6-phosphate 1-dehydrogenase